MAGGAENQALTSTAELLAYYLLYLVREITTYKSSAKDSGAADVREVESLL